MATIIKISEIEKKLLNDINNLLVGRTIVKITIMPEDITKEFGWYNKPIILHLDNGLMIYPTADDDGGSFLTSSETFPSIPSF